MRKVEQLCRKSYKKSAYGRPSIAPGVYFRRSADRLFRRSGFGARDRVADCRLAVVAQVPGLRAGRSYTGPFHNFAHAALVLAGDAQGGVPLGAEDSR